jgi:hypothetical protein
MKTYHWNGERWYLRDWSIFHRIRDWFVWVGGWETANGKGWRLFIPCGNRRIMMSPTPVSLFGHRITFYGWGWNIRTRTGWLVYTRRPERSLYHSTDGTPRGATVWYIGTPYDIRAEAE